MRPFAKGLCLVLLTLILLSLKTSKVFATTYYVDATNGLDTNSGTSTSAPWQTVAKVNSTTLTSGDYVYFKRGETWTFTLSTHRLVATSGVTYGAYGTGNAPTIDGDGVSDGMLGQDVSNVRIENLKFKDCYDACAQFIRTNNVSVVDCEMSGAGNDNLIFITDNNNVTISGGSYHDPVRRVAGTQVTNIELADGGTGFNISNVEVYGAENAGVTIHNHVGTQVPTNVVINKLNSHNNTTGNGLQILTQDQTNPVDIDITNSTFTSNNTGIRVFMSGSYYVNGSVLFDNIISGNNSAYGYFVQGDDVTIQRSVFYGTSMAGQVTNAKNLKFYNNTTYLTPASAIWMMYASGGARVDGVIVKNNIFYMANTSGNFVGTAALSSTNMDVDYNQYYFSPYAGNARWMRNGTAYTFANWIAVAGFDAHGLGATSNPLFVGAASQDFRLSSNSPSINKGVDVGLSYSGAAPDIGAFEYAPPVAPSSLAQSVSGRDLTFTFSMSSLDPTDTLTPNIEIQPWNIPFTNSANYSGTAVSYSGTSVTGTVSVSNFGSGQFHWQAMASNYAGNSTWTSYSSSATGTDFNIPFSAPGTAVCTALIPGGTPRLYSASSPDPTSLLLSFVPVSQSVSKYMIRYGVESGRYIYAADNIEKNTSSYLIKELFANKKYYFQIAAGNGCATSDWSAEFSATTGVGTLQISQREGLSISESSKANTFSLSPAPVTNETDTSSGIQENGFFDKIMAFLRKIFSPVCLFFSDLFENEIK